MAAEVHFARELRAALHVGGVLLPRGRPAIDEIRRPRKLSVRRGGHELVAVEVTSHWRRGLLAPPVGFELHKGRVGGSQLHQSGHCGCGTAGSRCICARGSALTWIKVHGLLASRRRHCLWQDFVCAQLRRYSARTDGRAQRRCLLLSVMHSVYRRESKEKLQLALHAGAERDHDSLVPPSKTRNFP